MPSEQLTTTVDFNDFLGNPWQIFNGDPTRNLTPGKIALMDRWRARTYASDLGLNSTTVWGSLGNIWQAELLWSPGGTRSSDVFICGAPFEITKSATQLNISGVTTPYTPNAFYHICVNGDVQALTTSVYVNGAFIGNGATTNNLSPNLIGVPYTFEFTRFAYAKFRTYLVPVADTWQAAQDYLADAGESF